MNLRTKVVTLANAAFIALVIYAGAKYVVPLWTQYGLTSRYQALHLGWLGSAVGLFLLQSIAVFGAWHWILRSLGVATPTWPLYRAFALSLIPKYMPGKVISQGVRVGMAAKAGVSARITAASLVWEMGLALASAAFVAAIGLLYVKDFPLEESSRRMFVVFLAVALVIGIVLVLPEIGAGVRRWLSPDAAPVAPMRMWLVVAIYLGSWVISTLAHFNLARAIAPLSAQLIPDLLVALCVSWGVGMLSVFAPAGLGVREGILFLFMRQWMGDSSALLFVILSRLCVFVAEVVLTLVAIVGPTTAEISVSMARAASGANAAFRKGDD